MNELDQYLSAEQIEQLLDQFEQLQRERDEQEDHIQKLLSERQEMRSLIVDQTRHIEKQDEELKKLHQERKSVSGSFLKQKASEQLPWIYPQPDYISTNNAQLSLQVEKKALESNSNDLSENTRQSKRQSLSQYGTYRGGIQGQSVKKEAVKLSGSCSFYFS